PPPARAAGPRGTPRERVGGRADGRCREPSGTGPARLAGPTARNRPGRPTAGGEADVTDRERMSRPRNPPGGAADAGPAEPGRRPGAAALRRPAEDPGDGDGVLVVAGRPYRGRVRRLYRVGRRPAVGAGADGAVQLAPAGRRPLPRRPGRHGALAPHRAGL